MKRCVDFEAAESSGDLILAALKPQQVSVETKSFTLFSASNFTLRLGLEIASLLPQSLR